MPILQDSPKTLVLKLANQANSPIIPFSESNICFGKPTVLPGHPVTDIEVAVRGIQDINYLGKVKIQYRRLDVGKLFSGAYQPVVSALGQSNLYRLLPALNQALGTNFTEDDLVDVDLTLLDPGDQVILDLVAKDTSVAYVGDARVLFNRIRLQLVDVVTNRALAELNHPDPIVAGWTSAGLLTWGLDFTLIASYLKVNKYAANYRGNWADLSGLQAALLTNYNIDGWPGLDTSTTATDTIRDYDTSAVPEANKDFQRVVVQTKINSNGYVGTAYFHYNI